MARMAGFPCLVLGVALCSGAIAAEISPDRDAKPESPRRWGLAFGLRYSDIPFEADDQTVTDIVPLLFYEGDLVFLNGLEGGVTVVQGQRWRLNALTRYRFFDLPRSPEEATREDAWDIGLQLRHPLHAGWDIRWEWLNDTDGASYLNAGVERRFGDDYSSVTSYAGLRLKSARFNDRYFGLGTEALGGGVDWHARLDGRFHITGNLYTVGSVSAYYLDSAARASALMRDDFAWEAFAGFGVFSRPRVDHGMKLPHGAYFRLAYGWATFSDVGSILRWETAEDPYRNRLTSLFYGHPITDELFGIPLAIYLTPGIAIHHRSQVQDASLEYVVAIKAFYTLRWSIRTRLGIAEGLSYAVQVPYVERTKVEGRGQQPSKFLNHLDFSVDVNVGDLLGSPTGRNVWVGYSMHHRSGIFESGSQFGHLAGGGNYNTIYLQWHF